MWAKINISKIDSFVIVLFSPLIKTVNENCSPEFKSYNKCINENTDQLHVCLDVLEVFNNCASKAAKAFIEKQQANKWPV